VLVNGQASNKDIREKFLKRICQLSLKTIGEIPQLDEPSFEQKQFLKSKGVK
jgi:hypothetical protein